MKTQVKKLLKDPLFIIGLGSVLISLGVYSLPAIIAGKISQSFFGIFLFNYLISIAYFFLLWFRELRFSKFNEKIEYLFLHFILCLISAYSLNRGIAVFEKSTDWLQIFLLLQGLILVSAFFKQHFPSWINIIFWISMGIVASVFMYMSFYIIPLYPLGFIAGIFLGISLHVFIPLSIVIEIIIFLLRKDNRSFANIIAFISGASLCLIITFVFMVKWYKADQIIINASDKALLDERNDLPEWVRIAQSMKRDKISEKLLKSGLVYTVADNIDSWELFDIPGNYDEVRKHDPLVVIATFFMGKPALTDQQKIKILESMYDSRHHAQERLWSGDDLQTSHILTNIRLYPDLRLAYTEKIISIRNKAFKNSWPTQQEAIYTFHLPEGSIVTSLSLWINGKEEKSILTSKGKADTAYNSIVGYERRDPSIVRWQEGNTVSVRIFPCTPNEDRKFKIGITSPLIVKSDSQYYNSIVFDGPSPFHCRERIKIESMDELEYFDSPKKFVNEEQNVWDYEGYYLPDWNVKMPISSIKQNCFNFEGKSYQISEYKREYKSITAENIYLDINSEWTKAEFFKIINALKNRNVYAFKKSLVKINEKNAEKIFEYLSSQNYSIFPLYEVKHPDKSIIITKGTLNSPNLADLNESDFANKLKEYLVKNEKFNIFNINQVLSPYLKSLKELRAFNYDFGTVNDLVTILSENEFIESQENTNTIVINDANIKITESDDTLNNTNAPDHLMRLFSYNNVMYNTGYHYFENNFYDQKIIDKAYKAYVVSPVTSLIVLESSNDYERFDIKDDGSSLKNASMKSAGAVPEPHEWVLILIMISMAIYLYYRK